MSRWCLAVIVLMILFLVLIPLTRAEYCCERHGVFTPIDMPPQQERDCTGMLDASLFSALREGPTRTCPIRWAEMSYSAREFLQWMVDTLGRISQVPPDPQADQQYKNYLDCDYVWRASLTLHEVTETIPGETVEGYMPGSTDYEPGYVRGDWTLEVKLVNVHFEEVVEQGSIGFRGTCSADGGEAMKDLVRAYFVPIGQIVYDYEQVPTTCFIEPETDSIEAGVKTIVYLKKLWDDQARPAKEWQRIVVKIEHGEILNGVRCSDDDKAYAFKVGNGDVEVEYIAEQDCEDKTETFTVYNACTWGREDARAMTATDMEEEIDKREVRVYDRRPDTCSIRPTVHPIEAGETVVVEIKNVKDKKDSRVGPHERLMVKAAKGKIVNGMPKDDYRVFEVGKGTVKVEYEAPDNCDVSKDTFFVYEACVTGDEYLDVTPGDKVAEKELKITCEWTWTGNITIEWMDRFTCEHTDDNENATRIVSYSEERTQRALLNIRADDILEGDAIMDARMGDDWQVFGDLKSMMDHRYYMENTHKKQRDAHSLERSQTNVDELFTLNSDNVSLIISRDPGDFEDASKKMQDMVAEIMASGGDEKMIEEAMKSVDNMFSVDQSSVPLRFILQVYGDFTGAIETSKYRVVNDSLEEDSQETAMGPAALPMAAEVHGKLTRKANGGGSIEGSANQFETAPGGKAFECPERQQTQNTYISLTARQKKN